MRRVVVLILTAIATSVAMASSERFQLSGWAEIPSTYRHPGPVSGQFAGPANGVTPPYAGQPIPGFSGMIPHPRPGRFFALPDNGFGAQENSADFVIGFYEVTPSFKRRGDGTTFRGPVIVHRFTPFSDPLRFLDSSYITNGPVYARQNYYPTGPQIPVDAAIRRSKAVDRRRLRRRIDCPHGGRLVLGWRRVRALSPSLRCAGAAAEPADPPSSPAGAAEPTERRCGSRQSSEFARIRGHGPQRQR